MLSLMRLSEFSLVCKNFGFYFVNSVEAFFSHQRNWISNREKILSINPEIAIKIWNRFNCPLEHKVMQIKKQGSYDWGSRLSWQENHWYKTKGQSVEERVLIEYLLRNFELIFVFDIDSNTLKVDQNYITILLSSRGDSNLN